MVPESHASGDESCCAVVLLLPTADLFRRETIPDDWGGILLSVALN